MLLRWLAAAPLLLFSCAGPDPGIAESGEASSRERTSVTPAPCERVEVGGPCTKGDSCNLACNDPCQSCLAFVCGGGRWERLEGHPQDCFECGDVRCETGMAYCDRSGARAICRDAPPACEGTPTCDCVPHPETSCEVARPGAVTIVKSE